MQRNSPRSTRHQRFSGTELADVLQEVHDEYGPSAAITEVNRVRSGGFAGFFAREEFEVIVADDADTDRDPEAASDEVDLDDLDLWADDPADDPADEMESEHPGEPRPDGFVADERFRLLLERAIEERAEAEDAANLRSIGHSASARSDTAPSPSALPPVPPSPSAPQRVAEPEPELPVAVVTEGEPDVIVERSSAPAPAPALETEFARRRASVIPVAEVPAGRRRDDGFWVRLDRARREVEHLVAAQPALVGVVGPLRSIVPILRTLERHDEGAGQREVIVLTSRAEIVSQPTWRLVRDGSRLVNAISTVEGPAVVAIDVEDGLPIWVGPLLDRLRRNGMELVRVAVPGQIDDRRLGTIERAVAGPLLIDVLGRVAPRRALDLVDQGRPVASIGGVPMTGELLVALRREAQRG